MILFYEIRTSCGQNVYASTCLKDIRREFTRSMYQNCSIWKQNTLICQVKG